MAAEPVWPRFNLRRYFIRTSAVIAVVVALIATVILNRALLQQELAEGQQDATMLALHMEQDMLDLLIPLLASPQGPQAETLQARFAEHIVTHIRSGEADLVRVYDANGQLLAAEPELPAGQDLQPSSGLREALQGRIWTRFTTNKELVAEKHVPEEVLPRYVFEAYVPIEPREGLPVRGVFEIYRDATVDYERAARVRNLAIGVLLGGMALLFAALSVIAHRAQMLLEQRTMYLEAQYRLVRAATRAGDLRTWLKTILDSTLAAFAADKGVVCASGREVTSGLAAEGCELDEGPKSLPLSGFTGPLAIVDLERAEMSSVPAKMAAWMAQVGIRALLMAPIYSGQGEVIGALTVASARPRRWARGEIALLETVGREIGIMAERLQLIARLQEANLQLEEALRAKDIMIQNISHELRTPLAIIQGYLELMVDQGLGPLTRDQTDALEVMLRNAERQRFMIDRLLLMRTLGPETMETTPVELGLLIKEIIDGWRPRLAEAGITLTAELPDSPLWIKGDRQLLAGVFDNLLHNAIKFSPNGGVVSLAVQHSTDAVLISISDQGIGVPPDKLERIFDRFYQVDSGTKRRFGGLGIGLALCREIIALHGGRIWAESQGEGQGTTFWIKLTAAASSSAP